MRLPLQRRRSPIGSTPRGSTGVVLGGWTLQRRAPGPQFSSITRRSLLADTALGTPGARRI